jgi:invasion protein IalB
MALGISQARRVGRIRRAGAVALALTMGMASLANSGAAQQAPPKKSAPAGAMNTWVKLCGKTPVGVMYKDGKEEPKLGDFCVTQYERFDETTGALASVTVRKSDAEDRPFFAVTVPLGMVLPAGVRAALYPAGPWEQAQKNEKVDDSKLKGLTLDYKTCIMAGCVAEIEATPELFNDLKTFKGIVVFAINAEKNAVGFPVPLTGFEQAYAGNPVDAKLYLEGRQALMQKIAQQRKQLGPTGPGPIPKK